MSGQLRSSIPKAPITVVCWATLLFTCVGALSSVNALAIIYEVLGATAVASAIYLILEFSQPLFGAVSDIARGHRSGHRHAVR
jgi:hypothetical protein